VTEREQGGAALAETEGERWSMEVGRRVLDLGRCPEALVDGLGTLGPLCWQVAAGPGTMQVHGALRRTRGRPDGAWALDLGEATLHAHPARWTRMYARPLVGSQASHEAIGIFDRCGLPVMRVVAAPETDPERWFDLLDRLAIDVPPGWSPAPAAISETAEPPGAPASLDDVAQSLAWCAWTGRTVHLQAAAPACSLTWEGQVHRVFRRAGWTQVLDSRLSLYLRDDEMRASWLGPSDISLVGKSQAGSLRIWS
jgi:putative heme degradation protein